MEWEKYSRAIRYAEDDNEFEWVNGDSKDRKMKENDDYIALTGSFWEQSCFQSGSSGA
jgi:hypothetical protein